MYTSAHCVNPTYCIEMTSLQNFSIVQLKHTLLDGIVLYDAPEGFTIVPTDPYFAVSVKGEVWSRRANKLCKLSNGPGGYKTVGINWKGKTLSRYVHRLVAITHVPIPTYLQGFDIEVNHISRDKTDNSTTNLEWVTPKLNIRHAYKTGAYGDKTISQETEMSGIYSTKIDVKNVKTGMVVTFDTLNSVCSLYNIDKDRLKRHLASDKAGLITKNWCVFRLNTKSARPWPVIEAKDMVQHRWDLANGFWIIRNVADPTKVFSAEKMPKISEVMEIPLHLLQYNVKNDGKEYTYSGWVFKFLGYPSAHDFELAPVPEPKSSGYKPPRQMEVTDLATGVITIYKSGKEASKKTQVAESSMFMALKKKDGVHNGLKFRYVD